MFCYLWNVGWELIFLAQISLSSWVPHSKCLLDLFAWVRHRHFKVKLRGAMLNPSHLPNLFSSRDLFQSIRFVCAQLLSCVWLYATPQTVAHQASLSMGFFRQEYWSGLLFRPPGESSWSRDWTCVSCIGRWFFTTVPPRQRLPLKAKSKTVSWTFSPTNSLHTKTSQVL